MSKITKALEKAARERLLRTREHATVAPVQTTLAVERRDVGAVATVDTVQVDPHVVSAVDPKSPIAEQYRIFRTNLQQSLKLRQGAQVIALTSAIHGEGKSVTSINLALTLARQEQLKVVLVDADLRKSSIQRWLGLEKRDEGLSTVLEHGGELNGSLLRLQSPPLTVLPAGAVPDHPAELLESAAMKRLLATLRTQFDVIIIDTPPVLPVADPGIVGVQADGVLLVVKAGKTQRKTVVQAMTLLKQMKVNLVGSVLTHVEYYLPGYYRYYHYYRYEERTGKVGKTKRAAQGQQPATSHQPQTTDVASS